MILCIRRPKKLRKETTTLERLIDLRGCARRTLSHDELTAMSTPMQLATATASVKRAGKETAHAHSCACFIHHLNLVMAQRWVHGQMTTLIGGHMETGDTRVGMGRRHRAEARLDHIPYQPTLIAATLKMSMITYRPKDYSTVTYTS